jgi:phosphoglycolate phosphatase-like HAD superfamily hydrolase
MSQKIILFDFDKTVSDTNGFVKKFSQSLYKKFNISGETVVNILQEYNATLESTTDFRPEGFSRAISEKTGIDINLIQKNVFDPKNFPIFEEVRNVLAKLSINNRLGIFSEGFNDWQKNKIKMSNILGFFEESLMIIERRKLSPESIKKIPNGVIVIDDKRIVIETLANTRPDLNLVWINRLTDEKIETTQIRTIKNLNELLFMN